RKRSAPPVRSQWRRTSDCSSHAFDKPAHHRLRGDPGLRMKAAAIRAVLLLGIFYCAVGLLFGILAGQAGSTEMRMVWRRAAWVVSAIAFEAHLVYDHVRLGGSRRLTALRVSTAAALGAFGLAVAANIHARSVAPDERSPIRLD